MSIPSYAPSTDLPFLFGGLLKQEHIQHQLSTSTNSVAPATTGLSKTSSYTQTHCETIQDHTPEKAPSAISSNPAALLAAMLLTVYVPTPTHRHAY